MATKTNKASTKPSDIYAQMKALYSPAGSFMSGIQASLDRLGKKANAQGMSNLIGSGLAGTSMAGNLSTAFAEDVAAPQLLQAESQRIGALTNIMGQEANYYANLPENIYGTTTTIAPSKMGSIFSQPSSASKDTSYDQRMAEWRAGGMSGNNRGGSPSSSYPSVNVGEVSDSIMPASLRGAVQSEPNWVTINGKKYTQNANGQFVNSAGTPLGLAR